MFGRCLVRTFTSAVPDSSAISKALEDGTSPLIIIGRKIRSCYGRLGCKNWLFAGAVRNGKKRAAAIMSLIQSARLYDHDPYVYLKGLLTRLPTQRAR